MNALRLFFCIACVGFFQTSFAADQALGPAFAEYLDTDFFGFETIGHKILQQMVHEVPEQTTLWGCGLHQCGHIVACANNNGDGTHQLTLNYQEPHDYPLSINVNLHKFSLQDPRITTDEHGNFRVGPVPVEMANFINERLPSSCAYGAKAESSAALGVDRLIEIVKNNLAINMPTLVYYVVDENRKLMHFYSIVGLNDNGNTPEFMVLDTKGLGKMRLKKFNAEEFHKSMNAQAIVSLVKDLDKNFGLIIRLATASQPGARIVSSHRLQQWENYSVISFVAKSELPQQEEVKPMQTQCAQQ